jgi:uncharacterized protein
VSLLPRVVLDANVLISAAIRPSGVPGQIATAFLAEHRFELVLTLKMCDELDRALRRKKVQKYLEDPQGTLDWLYDLVILADMVQDTDRARGVCRDPADDVVLAAAVEGRAAVIVSGDDDLLALEEYDDIPIMAPRAFLNVLRR